MSLLRYSRRVVGAAAILFGGLVLLLPLRCAAGVIDDFSDGKDSLAPQSVDQSTGRNKSIIDRGPIKGVLGGTRQLNINTKGSIVARGDAITVWVNRRTNRIEYAGSLKSGGSLELVYDSSGQGLNADWGSSKGIGILFNADVSAVPYKVTLTVTDKAGKAASTTQTVNAAGAQEADLLFSGLSGVNVRKVVRLSLLIEPQVAGDFEVIKVMTLDVK